MVLVTRLDAALLEDVAHVVHAATNERIVIRLDTAKDVLRCADVFPVFALELLDTKELVFGRDVLDTLAVHPAELRGRIEQSLRHIHRELLQTYLVADGDRGLAKALRASVRKSIYLLRALTLVSGQDVAAPSTVEALIDAVTLIDGDERPMWHRMRRFAAFEDTLEHAELVRLYSDALNTFASLIDRVDTM